MLRIELYGQARLASVQCELEVLHESRDGELHVDLSESVEKFQMTKVESIGYRAKSPRPDAVSRTFAEGKESHLGSCCGLFSAESFGVEVLGILPVSLVVVNARVWNDDRRSLLQNMPRVGDLVVVGHGANRNEGGRVHAECFWKINEHR